ncbi:BON domain-containing protein [Litchfieldella xinjiangensis]|uniref:BON domain-containing protein n=1 Tax=Litchfieldella xinjiangensis TaxID=1166948 RepID=UPI0005BBC4B0|nr:BON domain-containing protein [Halomonas xinjiangensis]
MKTAKFVTPALLGLALALSGCTTLTSATHQGPVQENYGERTFGSQVEDQSIETKIRHNLSHQDARFNDARVNVDSYNGVVLLSGQVPSDELKEKAMNIAKEVRNVRQVHNELAVAANIPLAQRTNDTWVTARIRTRLIGNENIDAGRIRAVTENGSVYLMGLVTRAEGDRVVNAISDIGGVQRIVKVFEYLD